MIFTGAYMRRIRCGRYVCELTFKIHFAPWTMETKSLSSLLMEIHFSVSVIHVKIRMGKRVFKTLIFHVKD